MIKLCSNIAQDFLALANAAFKYTDTHQASEIDISINGTIRNHVIDANSLTLLSSSIDTTDTLLDSHRIPRKIIVNHHIAELII